jgi:hypothetical protein
LTIPSFEDPIAMNVHRLRVALILTLTVILIPAHSAAQAGHRITIPNGTQVSVSTVKTLLPKASSANEAFAIRADDNVVVDGYVVVKKGALGQGTITETGSHKFTQVFNSVFHHGSVVGLRIRFDWIRAVDGEKIRLAYLVTDGTPEGGNPAVTKPAEDYATSTSLGSSGMIPAVQTFTTFVSGTVHVVSTLALRNAPENQSGFAH